MGCGGLCWGGVGVLTFCLVRTVHISMLPKSLECLPRYMLLRCQELWNACHVTCCYAAEISGMLATLYVATLPRSLECLPYTGTIVAAWTSCKQFTPKALGVRHKDLILYAKMWQWRFVNKYKNLLQKTADMLHKLEWKKECLILSDRNEAKKCILLW